MEDKMKKMISFICAIFCCFVFVGCTPKEPTIEIADDVSFELMDVMTITNDESNSIYYYYMAKIANDSKETYTTDEVIYSITDQGNDKINPIDEHESMPISTVLPEQTAYIYGYIGFPNSNQEAMGFYFNGLDEFVSFESVDIRKADNHDIQESDKLKFTIYEDKALKIDIDASQCDATFENGTTTLSNFIITYTNKTEKQITVPYFEPQATLKGLDLAEFESLGDFSKMNEDQIKKIDFTKNSLEPKTSEITGQAYGYIVEYLDPEQSIDCNVGFTFENAAINYKSGTKDCFDLDLVSRAFGITHSMEVSYSD